ncbi:MAG: LD-carboxypeptidase, partial [Burkholderiales bacterium]|nr:LD-carboxypeptidase [Burkholderiales bacterium]
LPRAVPEPATIGVCALSGRVDEAAVASGAAYLRELGHNVVVAEETTHAWRYFAGTDEERLQGFHRLLDDPSIDLIMFARGGYGLTRLLHRIDWSRVAASGKAFVGFSDFTAFNMAAYACANLVTYHGPMLAIDFGKGEPDSFAQQHFWMAISNETHRIDDVPSDHGYDERRIEGRLWGGNLSLLANLAGTPYFPAIDEGILYVEEIAEEPYAIERMFLQLYHCGTLGRQRALLLGDFTDCKPENSARYPYSLEEVIETLRNLLPFPVLTGLPFGHVARKVTLPFGAPGTLIVRDGTFSLRFSGYNSRVIPA